MTELRVKEITASSPLLAGALCIRKLVGGPTSDSWLMQLDGIRAVLRADKPLARRLGLNRRVELDAIDVAAKAGFGPQVLWADPDRGLLVTRYIAGMHWRKSDASSLPNVQRLAERMREIHSVNIPAPVMDIEATAARYAELTNHPQSRDLLTKVRAVIKEVRTDLTEYGFCHNDPGYRNIVDTGTVMLVDWEYAARGVVWFDLAGATLQNRYSKANTLRFAEYYCGGLDEVIERRLKLFSQLYALISALWCLVVSESGNNMANQAQLDIYLRHISRGLD